jgi:DNA-directed RNA polymerase subunit H (RpoH/RPB5)
MHTLQPKHTKLKKEEVEELTKKFNISVAQLPRILQEDVCVPENCQVGDVVKIERFVEDKPEIYFRVVS